MKLGSALLAVILIGVTVGCASDSATQGNTGDISREIPKPKEGGPTFKPPGNSLMKGGGGSAAVAPTLTPEEMAKAKADREKGKAGLQ